MLLPGLLRAGQDFAVPVEREGSLLASFGDDREEGSEAVSPVAIVWPCPLPVDAYAAAGREVEFPRPDCPSCAGPMTFWSGYRRHVRGGGPLPEDLRAAGCGARGARVSHALLPAFVLAWRLDAAETVGAVLAEVAAGRVRGAPGGGAGRGPAYDGAGLGAPVRRPGRGAGRGVRGAGRRARRGAGPPAGRGGRFALAAIRAAFGAAAALAGMAGGWACGGSRRR